MASRRKTARQVSETEGGATPLPAVISSASVPMPKHGTLDPHSLAPMPDKAQNLLIARQKTEVTQFSGPVPPPEILEQYERIVPGSAARILDQAQKQTDHRIQLENKVVGSDIARSYWGLAAGFVVTMTCLLGGMFLVYNDHDGAGGLIATGSVATLAAVFVYGKEVMKRERVEKAKVMTGQVSEKK